MHVFFPQHKLYSSSFLHNFIVRLKHRTIFMYYALTPHPPPLIFMLHRAKPAVEIEFESVNVVLPLVGLKDQVSK